MLFVCWTWGFYVLDFIPELPIATLDADAVLDIVVAAERRIVAAQAMQVRALARFAQLRPNGNLECPMDEFTADEVAPALHLSRNAAAARLDMATALTTRLPATLAALERGEIDMIKARAVVQATDPLTGEQALAVQERVLGRAGGQTASQLRASLRRAVLRVDPDGAAQRHQQRRKERQVTLVPLPDAMAELVAHLPAEQAVAIYQRVDALARKLLTDLVDGSLLDCGRTKYRPPAALRDYVRARDRTCRFPGCQQPARRCDLDHTVAYPEGPTSEHNLGTLCRRHHRLKHETEWKVEQHAGGFTWTNPTGRKYTRVPEPLAHPDA
jgi:hypothetical protein